MPNIAGEYRRHSVGKDVQEFEGWERILGRYEKIKKEEGYQIAQVYGSAFLTGGRITEVVTQKPSMFTPSTEIITLADGRQIERPVLTVKGMLLEKHYEKKSHYLEKVKEEDLPKSVLRRLFPDKADAEGFYVRRRFRTERLIESRKPFDIPLDEVPHEWRTMHEDLKWWLSANKGQPWLFPSTTKRTHTGRTFIWRKFKKYGIYPHYLRAQRASCLIVWNGLTMEQMMEWMSWEELQTAMHYAKMGKSKLLGVFRRFE